MTKGDRQLKILDLISTNEISTQEELNELLEKSGVFVNQSSVSRDLVELGIIKFNGNYTLPETRSEGNIFGLSSLQTAGDNLIVAKCSLGLASAACVKLDNARIGEIVGTIAGEDTIFIAVKDAKTQKLAIRKLWELFGK
jgi:transcriptional regulator of arginine metabolism